LKDPSFTPPTSVTIPILILELLPVAAAVDAATVDAAAEAAAVDAAAVDAAAVDAAAVDAATEDAGAAEAEAVVAVELALPHPAKERAIVPVIKRAIAFFII
jgi:hypothetical protein